MNHLLKQFQGNGLRAQLLKGTGGTAGIKGINILLTLVTSVLLARALGPGSYGTYAFVLSIITLLGLPTKAGLPTLLVRETARNQLNNNWGLIQGLLKLANGFVFGYSLLTGLIAGFLVWWYWGDTESVRTNTFLWALWLLPLLAFAGVRTGTLRGLRWIVTSQIPEQLIKPLMMVVFVGLVLIIGEELTAVSAIQLNVVAALIAFVVGSYFLFKALPTNVKQSDAEYTIRPWINSLLPLSLFAGLRMLDSEVAILFLGFLGSAEEVGLFRVAASGAALVTFGLTAINMALAPQVARLYKAGDMEKLQRMISISTRAVAAVSFPVALAFIMWGEELVTLVFGADYAAAATPLAILCVGQLVNASAGSVAVVLNMTGHDKQTLYGVVIAIISNSILAVTLIPNIGMLGAAISYSVSLSVWNVVLVFMVRRHTGLNTFLLSKN